MSQLTQVKDDDNDEYCITCMDFFVVVVTHHHHRGNAVWRKIHSFLSTATAAAHINNSTSYVRHRETCLHN